MKGSIVLQYNKVIAVIQWQYTKLICRCTVLSSQFSEQIDKIIFSTVWKKNLVQEVAATLHSAQFSWNFLNPSLLLLVMSKNSSNQTKPNQIVNRPKYSTNGNYGHTEAKSVGIL